MFNNETVAHNFIYGETSNGSNFYSEDYNYITILKSYSSNMAIKYKKENLIIVSSNISSYSNSSQKHHAHLRRAINNEDVIYISKISISNMISDNLDNNALKEKIYHYIELSKKQKRATKADYSYQINDTINQMKLILKYVKIDKRSIEYKTYLKIINEVNLEDLISTAEKSEKLEKQKQAIKRYKTNLKKLESFTGVSLKEYTKREINEYNFLKVVNDDLKTSGHVTVSLKEGITLYKLLLSGKNINGLKIGYYTIVKHDYNIVKIGCHTIALKEIKRVLGGLI